MSRNVQQAEAFQDAFEIYWNKGTTLERQQEPLQK